MNSVRQWRRWRWGEQAKLQRKLLSVLLTGTMSPAEAQQRLQALKAAIVPLRAKILTGNTQVEFDAIM